MRDATLTALRPLPDAAFRLLAVAFVVADSKGRAPAHWQWWAERGWAPPAGEEVVRSAMRTLTARGELVPYRAGTHWYAVLPRVALERQGKHPDSQLPAPPRAVLEQALTSWPQRAALMAELMDNHTWTIRERSVAGQTGLLPGVPDPAVPPAPAHAVRTDDAYRVMREWVLATKREPGRIFGDGMVLRKNRANTRRYQLVRKALEEYGLETVLAAVRGVTMSPHHMGDNRSGTDYTDLSLILRDGEHIERFAALYERCNGREGPHA